MITYPMAPTAIALRIDRKGVVSLSSTASRKIQKKQNLPRSNAIPSALPINSERAAFTPAPSFPLRKYAVASNKITIAPAAVVRSVSALLQIEASTEVPPIAEPLPKLVSVLIRKLPKLCQLGC
jgi:hypothetical protein